MSVLRPRGDARPLRCDLTDHVLEPDLRFKRSAGGMKRDRPGLVADDSVGGDAAPRLESYDRGTGVRAEDAVDTLRCRVPLGWSAVGQHPLETTDNLAPGLLLQCRHRAAVWKCGPRQRANDPIGGQTRT